MSLFDELHNATMPGRGDEPVTDTYADLEIEPPNIIHVGQLVGPRTVSVSSINMTYAWFTPCDQVVNWVFEHVHDFDEILILTGNDPENPHDLGAEAYVEIEGERRTFTTSTSVYVPAGTRHCPLGFTRVDRPFTFSALALSPEYRAIRVT